MADKDSKTKDPKAILKEFQALTDQKARKEFYESHPELREFISPVNFH